MAVSEKQKKLLLHLPCEDEINNRVESQRILSCSLVVGSWQFDYHRIVVQDSSDMCIGGWWMSACP